MSTILDAHQTAVETEVSALIDHPAAVYAGHALHKLDSLVYDLCQVRDHAQAMQQGIIDEAAYTTIVLALDAVTNELQQIMGNDSFEVDVLETLHRRAAQ